MREPDETNGAGGIESSGCPKQVSGDDLEAFRRLYEGFM